jgi:PAS domain S-box-containing protein
MTVLAGEKSKLEMMVRSMTDGVMLARPRGGITFMNAAAERMIGRPFEELSGKSLRRALKLVDPGTRTSLTLPSSAEMSAERKPRMFWHARLEGADGLVTPVDMTLIPIRGGRGPVKGVLVVLRDLSDVLEWEASRRDRQKIEAIGSMARSIERDINQQLASISGHASSVAESLIPTTRAHESTLQVLQAASQVGTVLRRLQSVARATDEESDAALEAVPLGAVVVQAVRLTEDEFGRRGIVYRIRNPREMPYVQADAEQLLDSIMHLFMNAADAMPKGGTLSVDAALKKEPDREYVALRVRDSGYGMQKDVLSRIFEPFFTTKDPTAAMGLGLTVVQTTTERWGGYVRVRSRPGKGSSLRLFIPRAATPEGIATEEPRTGGTVLVADDMLHVLEHVSTILGQAGFTVYTATSVDDCLALYEQHGPEIDVALVDAVMPGAGGARILEGIMAMDPSAAIIVTSGFSREYLRRRLSKGTWGFLQKPFEEQQLLGSIERALGSAKEKAT